MSTVANEDLSPCQPVVSSIMDSCSTAHSLSGSLHVPLVLWGRQPPQHSVTVVRCMPDARTVVTGSAEGQLVIWTHAAAADTKVLSPKLMLFGHDSAVCCLANTNKMAVCHTFVSVSKCGRMCLWDIEDGRCLDSVDSKYLHTEIYPHALKVDTGQSVARLFCIGHYSEIIVMDPDYLSVLFTLNSRVEQDWMTALCLLKPPNRPDICIALSKSGMVKIWSLTDVENRDTSNPVYEDESKQVKCSGGQLLTACPFNQRQMMIVCATSWHVYDASDFSQLTFHSTEKHRYISGCFTRMDKVALTCTDGRVYLFQLPRSVLKGKAVSAMLGAQPSELVTGNAPLCYCVLNTKQPSLPSSSPPCFYLHRSLENAQRMFVYRADRTGELCMWTLPDVNDKTIQALQQEAFDSQPTMAPQLSTSLSSAWRALRHEPAGIVGHLQEESTPTIRCTLYVAEQGRLFLGRSDGSVLMVSATQTIARQLTDITHINRSQEWPCVRVLHGHQGAVTCLLYPAAHSSRYDAGHFISGGEDFCVCLWDLNTGSRLHNFCVQAGPVQELLIPPNACTQRVLGCICSVAADHSVALISLKEYKCILLASRHFYPVKEIGWRPLDDFLLVRCSDNTVYVWQMETASLDRIVSGLLAEEVMRASEEQMDSADLYMLQDDQSSQAGASNAVQMMRAIKNKNIDAVKKIASDVTHVDTESDAEALPDWHPPMYVHGLSTSPTGPQFHLITFHLEALILGLLGDEVRAAQAASQPDRKASDASVASQSQSSRADLQDIMGGSEPLSGLLNKAKEKADKVLQLSPAQQRKADGDTTTGRPNKPMYQMESKLCIDTAQLLLSLLHAWKMDEDLDAVCVKRLGLLPPVLPLCFGHISKQGHLSVFLPSGVDAVAPNDTPVPMTGDLQLAAFARHVHWQLSSSMSGQHLLAVISAANCMMALQQAAFLPSAHSKRAIMRTHSTRRTLMRRMSTVQIDNSNSSGSSAAGSNPGAAGTSDGQVTPAVIEQLKAEQVQLRQGWSLLSAMHCVLLPELVTTGVYQAPLIEVLVRRWQDRCLQIRAAVQALLLRELTRMGPQGRQTLVTYWAQFLPNKLDASLSIFGRPMATSVTAILASSGVDDANKLGPNANIFTPLEPVSRVFGEAGIEALRRNQGTAIVLLAVIGAEFGEEMSTTADPANQLAGFSGKDTALAYATCQCLVELVCEPPSVVLPAFCALRSAGIDLLGRGFTVWQPYLDLSKVLMALLELCANSNRQLASRDAVLPVSVQTDAARTASNTLALIAVARPSAFINACSKEVTRYNAAAQHQTLQHSVSSPLLKARTEVLRLIEMLVEKQYAEMASNILQVGDVLVHCLDTSLLKTRNLVDVYPPIAKFSMVSYCSNTRRIAFGGSNGVVMLHELRTAKCQSIQAHTRAVTACALSEDGKHLVTYSMDEAKINFWQTSASLFGMGQSTTKCVKQVPAPGQLVSTPGAAPFGPNNRIRVVWIGTKSVTLMLPNGKEHRFGI